MGVFNSLGVIGSQMALSVWARPISPHYERLKSWGSYQSASPLSLQQAVIVSAAPLLSALSSDLVNLLESRCRCPGDPSHLIPEPTSVSVWFFSFSSSYRDAAVLSGDCLGFVSSAVRLSPNSLFQITIKAVFTDLVHSPNSSPVIMNCFCSSQRFAH